MNTMIPPLAAKAIAAGAADHRTFFYIGRGEAPETPIYRNGWWFQTVTKAPRRVAASLRCLETAYLPVTATIVGHEAPRLFQSPNPRPDSKFPPILPKIEKVKLVLGQVGGILMPVAKGLLAVAGFTAIATGYVLGFLFMAILSVDPVVIVRLADGSMILIAAYDEPVERREWAE